MSIAASFTVTKTCKQLKDPLTDNWIKMWYLYAREYCSAIRKDKLLPLATTGMDLESIMLSEISQKKS